MAVVTLCTTLGVNAATHKKIGPSPNITTQHHVKAPVDLTFPSMDSLETSPDRIAIEAKMGILVDRLTTLTAADVMDSSQTWYAITQRFPNFGYSRNAYWFRFQINNQTQNSLTRYVELAAPFINKLEFFHYTNDHLTTSYAVGSLKPFQERPIAHQNFVMPVVLAPGVNQFYTRIESTGVIEAPFVIWTPGAFNKASNGENLLQGTVFGVLLVMIIYNLIVFFTTRDIDYLYYVCFVACYLLFQFTLTGYSYAYLWPSSAQWNDIAVSSFIAGAVIFVSLFSNSFLRLDNYSTDAYRVMLTMTAIGFFLFIGSFVLPSDVSVKLSVAFSLVVTSTALIFGYWRWWGGSKSARFYCMAWTAVLLGFIILNFSKFGFLPTNLWTNNAPQIGMLVFVMALSITLFDRINHDWSDDKSLLVLARNESSDHERKARSVHDELVKSRQSADQIKRMNEKLLHLSSTDGLTQISNRAFFDATFERQFSLSNRHGMAVTIIMFDIDHFKHVNDTYGHPGGDACLRALAACIRPKIARAGDVLARYGGEEFVILLVGSNLDASRVLAESFRSAIEQMKVPFGDQTIRFTASFGLACVVPGESDRPQDLLALADKALYQAKHDGRNCVRVEADAVRGTRC